MSNINDYAFVSDSMKMCNACKRTRPLSTFKMLTDSIRSDFCDECLASILAVKRNTARIKRQIRAIRIEKCGGNFIARDKKKYVVLYGFKCAKCGGSENLEYDHIIPVAFGGKSTFNNMQVLCIKCNSEKGTNVIDYRHIEGLSKA